MSATDVTDALVALSVDDSTRRRSLPLVAPAAPDKSVFISLESTAVEVSKLIERTEDGTAVFIRAPVATGKSTLAAYLASSFPNKYVLVATLPFSEDRIKRKVVSAVLPGTEFQEHQFDSALIQARRRKLVLIFDEAHLLFGSEFLMSSLFKNPDTPRLLLFSAAAHGGSDGASYVTPSEIRAKFMWYPPMPDAQMLAGDLRFADVFLTAESVDFFLKLCGGHRGIFMSAMAWVQAMQNSNQQEWSLAQSVTEVRASLAVSHAQAAGGWGVGFWAAIAKSRAIVVNSKYSDLKNIPTVFAKVLVGGARESSELDNEERALTIAGFLVPERRVADVEFVEYNWADSEVRYGISNALMAQYYNDKLMAKMNLKSGLIRGMDQPTNCADLLARALPFLSFVNVVDIPTSTDGSNESPLSESLLPFEEHYNGSISNVLRRLGFSVSNPQSQSRGKVDVFVSIGDATFGVEAIMAERRQDHHTEHVQRFSDAAKTNYSQATFKCLVTIGLKHDLVLRRVQDTAADLGVDIIGLVVSQAHDSYSMYIKPAGGDQESIKGPVLFVCDHVAKSLTDNLVVVSAQELKHIDVEQEQKHDGPDVKAEFKKAEGKLEKAKTELKEAEVKLEKAEVKLEKAKESGDEDEIKFAKQGVAAAHEGVASAQKLVTYWTNELTK